MRTCVRTCVCACLRACERAVNICLTVQCNKHMHFYIRPISGVCFRSVITLDFNVGRVVVFFPT